MKIHWSSLLGFVASGNDIPRLVWALLPIFWQRGQPCMSCTNRRLPGVPWAGTLTRVPPKSHGMLNTSTVAHPQIHFYSRTHARYYAMRKIFLLLFLFLFFLIWSMGTGTTCSDLTIPRHCISRAWEVIYHLPYKENRVYSNYLRACLEVPVVTWYPVAPASMQIQ